MGCVWIPEGPEGDDFIDELIRFPAGAHDDDVDNASLIGRALDEAHPAVVPPPVKPKPKDRWDMEDGEGAQSWKVR